MRRGVLHRVGVGCAAVAVILVTAGCGGGGDNANKPPVIRQGLALAGATQVEVNKTVDISVGAVDDPEGDPLVFSFSAVRGKVDPVGPVVNSGTKYTAPSDPGTDTVTARASDSRGASVTTSLTFNVVASLPQPNTTVAGPQVKISGPASGSTQPSPVNVQGNASGLSSGEKIWTVVFIDGLSYPQRAALLVGNNWTAAAYLGGGTKDSGKVFDILAVVVNEQADQVFTGWIARGDQTGSYPGFPSLPQGAMPKDRIQVTLA